MTTLELIAEVDERLATGSDEDLIALSRELDERLAGADGELHERLAWRAERLAFVLRALDL